jgi:hypothetical protein
VLSVLPSRWKGVNILSLSASGTPGPQSITRRDEDPEADRLELEPELGMGRHLVPVEQRE